MIRFRLEPGDLALVRFAFSPLWELAMSVRALADPGRHAVHLPWVAEARPLLRDRELAPLVALAGTPRGYLPDFLAPPPTTPFPEFEAEIERMQRTPPDQVRREVAWLGERGRASSDQLERFVEDPTAALTELAELLTGYWDRVLARHWPRMRAVLESDILLRARRLAVEGADGLLSDLHPRIRYDDGVLAVDKRCVHERQGAGDGLLMIPSIFGWPDVYVVTDEPWRPSIMYPARGAGLVWLEAPDAEDAALEALVGRSRARVLREVVAPVTTGEIARRLGVTTSAASQHLTALARTGVVDRTRVGRRVYYVLSARGRALLELMDAPVETVG